MEKVPREPLDSEQGPEEGPEQDSEQDLDQLDDSPQTGKIM